MDTDSAHEASDFVHDADVGELVSELNEVGTSEGISFPGGMKGELGSAGEVIIKMELDLARTSEKLINLNVLMMLVATKENDFEAIASEKEHITDPFFEKAFEFDILSGFLSSEVKELEKFMSGLQAEIDSAREIISSYKDPREMFEEMEEKLCDSEKTLEQSQEQVSEIKMQCAKFHRALSFLDGEENWNDGNDVTFVDDGQFACMNANLRMQTAEQQRHILRMLEKSLAREMDLDKKLTDSRHTEEELKQRLFSLKQKIICVEEEAKDVCRRWFESENSAEVLMGISKGLLNKLQTSQFNLNSSVHRETELRKKVECSEEQLEAKESALQKLESGNAKVNDFLLAQTNNLKASLSEAEDELIIANSEAFTLREKVSLLEKQLEEAEFQLLSAKGSEDGSQEQLNDLSSKIHKLEGNIEDLERKLAEAENRVESSHAKCKLLSETNMELNEELGLLKGSGGIIEKVESLEKQLMESDIQLQHAVASAEASEEKQNMLYCTITDMENVIEGLKSKVSKAESRADSTEEKCIILSESNAEMNGELRFLRERLECMEASLNQAEETKIAMAKNIGMRTKVITSLVMQLAVERERLHKQISSLAMENKILVVKLQKTSQDPPIHMPCGEGKKVEDSMHNVPSDSCALKSEDLSVYENNKNNWRSDGSVYLYHEKMRGEPFTWTNLQPTDVDNSQKNMSVAADSTSELEIVRRIDAGVLNYKHIFVAVLTIFISAVTYLFQQN